MMNPESPTATGDWNEKKLIDTLGSIQIYVTTGQHPPSGGEIKLIGSLSIHSPPPSTILKSSESSPKSFQIMGTTSGAAAAAKVAEDKHIYILAPDITKEELMRKKRIHLNLNEESIALLYAKDDVHAIQAKCPHAGGPLHLGDIEDLPGTPPCIKCPWHSWQFNIQTGECVFPGREPDRKLHVYPVKVTNGQIRIGFNQIAPKYFKTPQS